MQVKYLQVKYLQAKCLQVKYLQVKNPDRDPEPEPKCILSNFWIQSTPLRHRVKFRERIVSKNDPDPDPGLGKIRVTVRVTKRSIKWAVFLASFSASFFGSKKTFFFSCTKLFLMYNNFIGNYSRRITDWWKIDQLLSREKIGNKTSNKLISLFFRK